MEWYPVEPRPPKIEPLVSNLGPLAPVIAIIVKNPSEKMLRPTNVLNNMAQASLEC